jgi:hypothetical protein
LEGAESGSGHSRNLAQCAVAPSIAMDELETPQDSGGRVKFKAVCC